MTIFSTGIGFEQQVIDSWKFFHKDLADLSNNGRHVVVNGTNHMNIIFSEETANHILSLIPEINEKESSLQESTRYDSDKLERGDNKKLIELLESGNVSEFNELRKESKIYLTLGRIDAV